MNTKLIRFFLKLVIFCVHPCEVCVLWLTRQQVAGLSLILWLLSCYFTEGGNPIKAPQPIRKCGDERLCVCTFFHGVTIGLRPHALCRGLFLPHQMCPEIKSSGRLFFFFVLQPRVQSSWTCLFYSHVHQTATHTHSYMNTHTHTRPGAQKHHCVKSC